MDSQAEYTTRPAHRGSSTGFVIVLAIFFGLVSGFAGTMLGLKMYQQGRLPFLSGAQAASVVPLAGMSSSSASSPNTFVQVADQLDESVVNINTTAQQQLNPIDLFYGNQPQIVHGLGTGVIVAADGYILTNFHVIDNARNIQVTVMHKGGKREYKAELIGGDKQEDLAVIKIDASGLRPVKFGDSDALRPGEWVMAIGNPFGFEHTVSVGVVSALNRDLPVTEAVTLRNMVQTDASINPGNSGGPLVNLRGEVVGINSAMYVGQGSGEPQARGIGFAIPSNHAVKIMDILRKHAKVPHPYIGIAYRTITDDMRANLHLPVKYGVFITQTALNGPAAKAGILQGDVIVSADGNQLQDQAALNDYVNRQNVGKVVQMDVRRWDENSNAWETKSIRVTLDNKPADYEQQMREQIQQQQGSGDNQNPDQGQGQAQPQQQIPRGMIPFPGQ